MIPVDNEQHHPSETRWWNRDLLEFKSFRLVALIVCFAALVILKFSAAILFGAVAVAVYLVLLKLAFHLYDERVEERERKSAHSTDEIQRRTDGRYGTGAGRDCPSSSRRCP